MRCLPAAVLLWIGCELFSSASAAQAPSPTAPSRDSKTSQQNDPKSNPRRKLVVGLPQAQPNGAGLELKPNVRREGPSRPITPPPLAPGSEERLSASSPPRVAQTLAQEPTLAPDPAAGSAAPTPGRTRAIPAGRKQPPPMEYVLPSPLTLEGSAVESIGPITAPDGTVLPPGQGFAQPLNLPWEGSPDGTWIEGAQVTAGTACDDCNRGRNCPPRFPLWGWNNAAQVEDGIGHERLAFAISEIELAQPSNNLRMRFDAAYNFNFPDRAEYFWARIGGRGPKIVDPRVNYQELRYVLEAGGPTFSATTEIPIRMLDPTLNPNTTGMGDMSVATKLVILDGNTWQITQFFKTTMPTGSAGKGLGTGHTAIEPGFLFRQKLNKETNLHYEIRYWVPLGSDPEHSGQILRYGMGVSRLLYESDDFAIIPTLEVVGWSVLDGRQTVFPSGIAQAADPIGIANLYPGVRFVSDQGCDLGLFELYLGGGFAISTDHWYDSLVRAELKWTY